MITVKERFFISSNLSGNRLFLRLDNPVYTDNLHQALSYLTYAEALAALNALADNGNGGFFQIEKIFCLE